jgi:hypothetical protein
VAGFDPEGFPVGGDGPILIVPYREQVAENVILPGVAGPASDRLPGRGDGLVECLQPLFALLSPDVVRVALRGRLEQGDRRRRITGLSQRGGELENAGGRELGDLPILGQCPQGRALFSDVRAFDQRAEPVAIGVGVGISAAIPILCAVP